MDLQQRIARLIRRQQLIPPGSRLLLAVSGGADSLALLHILHRLREELALELQVASLDHGMRGAAGAADAAFVREQGGSLGLKVTLGVAQGLRSEADARRARYNFLAETARAWNARHVAVAHHADDQAETVLLNLLRGSGLRGLGAMRLSAPLPGHPQLTLLRPLLEVPRSQLQAWCHAQGLAPRQDAGNDDLRLRRNRLRHETLPLLRAFNPRVEQALQRLAASAALDHDFIQQQLAARTAGALRNSEGRVRLRRATFNGLHPALQRHFVLNALRQLGGQDSGSEHVARALALAQDGVTGQRLTLPGSLQLRLEYDDLVLERVDAAPDWPGPLLPTGSCVTLRNLGETPLPGGVWQFLLSETPGAGAGPQLRLSLPPGAILTLGTRRRGDRFAPPGLRGHSQSLKKWMINQKLPRTLRMQIPLLRVDGAIAAIFAGAAAVPSAHFVAIPGASEARFVAIRRVSQSIYNPDHSRYAVRDGGSQGSLK